MRNKNIKQKREKKNTYNKNNYVKVKRDPNSNINSQIYLQ